MKTAPYAVMILAVLLMFMSVSSPAFAFNYENSPENLKALMKAIHEAISSGDRQTAAALSKTLFPDEERLRRGLKPDATSETVSTILSLHRKYMDEIPMHEIFYADPANNLVLVHGAVTEEIARNKKGTIVFQEFPGGAVKLAKNYLRPGVVFYEVELVKPGNDNGMKFHLFYWDGSGWSMIGPAWRAFR